MGQGLKLLYMHCHLGQHGYRNNDDDSEQRPERIALGRVRVETAIIIDIVILV